MLPSTSADIDFEAELEKLEEKLFHMISAKKFLDAHEVQEEINSFQKLLEEKNFLGQKKKELEYDKQLCLAYLQKETDSKCKSKEFETSEFVKTV